MHKESRTWKMSTPADQQASRVLRQPVAAEKRNEAKQSLDIACRAASEHLLPDTGRCEREGLDPSQ